MKRVSPASSSISARTRYQDAARADDEQRRTLKSSRRC
jgi:hypothetical protein